MSRWWPWDVLIVLGAYHGLNPGMGWLFAVARGLQERDRRALWRAFGPLALGHGLAIFAAVLLALSLGKLLPLGWLKWIVCGALLVVMALVAIVVYERLGIAFLRRAWLNVDLIWTVTLLLAGVITLFS